MKLQIYTDMIIEIMQQPKYPAEIVANALALTMHSDPERLPPKFTPKLGKFLIEAEHMSPTEHLNYTFLIQGVSRSFLAQITRHRIGSFTSASQHYQDYQTYPCIVSPGQMLEKSLSTLSQAYHAYEYLMEEGVPKEEARQVLPNAASVNLLWTVNARAIITFLRQRLCLRNVMEMRIFAYRLLSLVKPTFPELFDHVGPQCFMGDCMQGRMKCEVGPWVNFER